MARQSRNRNIGWKVTLGGGSAGPTRAGTNAVKQAPALSFPRAGDL
jgi:hypothetical protein